MSLITPASDFIFERPEVESSRILSPDQLTDYEVNALKEEQRRLNYFTDKSNQEIQEGFEQELFINLSLVGLLRRLSEVIITIINELLSITQETEWNDIILIFIKEDRLIYIGLLIFIIALSIYLIDVSS